MTDPRLGFSLRMGLFYGALFLIYGVQLPFLSVWLDWRGLSPAEIGFISALPFFARLVITPSIAIRADRSASHRTALLALAWLALAGALLLVASPGLTLIPLAVLLLMIGTATALPLAETIAMTGVRAHGLDYGRMRLWGSLTFIAANIAGGFAVGAWGAGVVAYALIGAAAATVLAAFVVPLGPARPDVGRRPSLAVAWRLLKSRDYILVLVAAGCIQASHAVIYTFGVLHWQENGLSPRLAGVLWAFGVIVEVGLFAISNRVVARLGPRGLLLIGAAGALVRWTAMALDPSFLLLIPLQALHALSYAATHIGTVHLAQTLAPEGTQGTSQALLSAFTAGIATGLTLAAAGVLYQAFGSLSYLAMTGLAAIGGAAALMIGRKPTG